MKYDIAIVGCGITGAGIALELSKFNLKVLVLEKENDVSMGTTEANSAIIHAGYDPKPGTKMAKLNVLGSRMTKDLAQKLNFHYKQIGSLVIGRKEQDKELIDTLYQRGVDNGINDMKVLSSREEILAVGEDNLEEDIDYALYAPSAAICSPWEMCLAFMETAVSNGVELKVNSKVNHIRRAADTYVLDTASGVYEANYVINCAGVDADDVYTDALGHKDFEIKAVKGEYYLLDKDQGSMVKHVIFQTPSKLGKGVLISPTVHGNLIVGPNAADNDEKERTNNTPEGLATVREKFKLSSSKVNIFDNIRNFAGNRATIPGYDDFLIEESEELPHFINFAGIKSPGLSSAAAFGIEAKEMLEKDGLVFEEKKDFHYCPLPTYFKELSLEEKEKAIKENPLFGRVICRCETITEGEIVAAIHMKVGATTIDGVKRRCNAGMGRCQGGFCGPKVFDILRRELHLNYDEVYQDRNGSQVVVAETKEVK
jgi:glycerol-3-phosphate dehydrogenase